MSSTKRLKCVGCPATSSVRIYSSQLIEDNWRLTENGKAGMAFEVGQICTRCYTVGKKVQLGACVLCIN